MNHKPKFILFVGLPGSGVHEEAKKIATKEQAMLYTKCDCSYQYMSAMINYVEYMGDTLCMNNVIDLLRGGTPVVLSYYHVKSTTRTAILNRLKDVECEKICYFVARPYDQCIQDTNGIERQHLLKIYNSMIIPWYYEGWDDIKLIKTGSYDNSTRDLFENDMYGLKNYMIKPDGVEKYMNIEDFSLKCFNKAVEKNMKLACSKALLFHQIGFPLTHEKSLYDFEIRTNNISGYMSLFYTQYDYYDLLRITNEVDNINDLYIAVLIQWIDLCKNQSDEFILRLNEYFGKELTQDLIDISKIIKTVIDSY